MSNRLVARWGMKTVEALQNERRRLRTWLRGRIRHAKGLARTYRDDGALHTAEHQEGRAEAFKAVLLALDAEGRKRRKAR